MLVCSCQETVTSKHVDEGYLRGEEMGEGEVLREERRGCCHIKGLIDSSFILLRAPSPRTSYYKR